MLFKTRILHTQFNCTKSQCFGFFIGGVLYGEVDYIIKKKQNRIVIAGRKELRASEAYLLRTFSNKEIK